MRAAKLSPVLATNEELFEQGELYPVALNPAIGILIVSPYFTNLICQAVMYIYRVQHTDDLVFASSAERLWQSKA